MPLVSEQKLQLFFLTFPLVPHADPAKHVPRNEQDQNMQ